MADKKEILVDGIEKIHLAGGLIRIDCYVLEPQGEGVEPVKVPSLRIVMNPEGFGRSMGPLTQLTDELVSRGLYQRNAADAKAKK